MEFSLEQVKEIVDNSFHIDDPFINSRLAEYHNEYGIAHPYYQVFYHLAKKLKPRLTVELGAWQCTAAICFASGYSKGKVVTIDHHSDPGDDLNQGKCTETLALYDNLIYLRGWTWDVIGAVKGLNIPIDILFIDSWHHYEYAKRDWGLYSPLLNSPALIICDDILKGDSATIAGMQRFWDELPGEKWLEERSHSGIPMGWIKWIT